jgi:hypothetical protein
LVVNVVPPPELLTNRASWKLYPADRLAMACEPYDIGIFATVNVNSFHPTSKWAPFVVVVPPFSFNLRTITSATGGGGATAAYHVPKKQIIAAAFIFSCCAISLLQSRECMSKKISNGYH